MNGSFNYDAHSIANDFALDWSTNSTKVIATVEQKFYSVFTDDLAPSDFYSDSSPNQVDGNDLYVSNINYGRILIYISKNRTLQILF